MTCEVEPVGHEMTVVVWGEGRKYPASNTEGAKSVWIDHKICQVELVKKDGSVETIYENKILKIVPGERIRTFSAGGGAVGPPLERDPVAVVNDVLNEKVSVEGARVEYGVVIDPKMLQVDEAATTKLRAKSRDTGHHGV